MNNIIFLILFLFFNVTFTKAQTKKSDLHFIVIGHTYSTIKTQSVRKAFLNKVNIEKPDYVFILGDSQINDSLVFNDYNSKIDAKVFFSPGNHEVKGTSLEDYKKRVGYLNTTIVDNRCNFIVLNSLESVENINIYLNEAFKKINYNNPIVLLTHFRIWDENLLSEKAYQHDKSYLFDEIDLQFREKIDYIFAGNSSAQYFDKQYCPEHKVNKNVAFWVDMIDNITCYSVGMKHNLNFTNAILRSNKLVVYPTSLPIEIKNEKEQKNVAVIEKSKTEDLKIKQKDNKKLYDSILKKMKSKSIWLSFFLGIFCTILFFKFIKFK
ncbi:metallophosphoesterase [Algibacter aquimarinus]|uniref:metallophosphoesterase n=1 Tax=Algibacter aquimarinus TaxID=1136748 RepID=UPI0031EBF170